MRNIAAEDSRHRKLGARVPVRYSYDRRFIAAALSMRRVAWDQDEDGEDDYDDYEDDEPWRDPSWVQYSEGDIIVYRSIGGAKRRVFVEIKEDDIKDHEPGFDGIMIGSTDPADRPGSGVWGKDKAVLENLGKATAKQVEEFKALARRHGNREATEKALYKYVLDATRLTDWRIEIDAQGKSGTFTRVADSWTGISLHVDDIEALLSEKLAHVRATVPGAKTQDFKVGDPKDFARAIKKVVGLVKDEADRQQREKEQQAEQARAQREEQARQQREKEQERQRLEKDKEQERQRLEKEKFYPYYREVLRVFPAYVETTKNIAALEKKLTTIARKPAPKGVLPIIKQIERMTGAFANEPSISRDVWQYPPNREAGREYSDRKTALFLAALPVASKNRSAIDPEVLTDIIEKATAFAAVEKDLVAEMHIAERALKGE